MTTCWIGLDDSTTESGCVHYVPGSHRWGLLPKGSLTEDMDAVKKDKPRRAIVLNFMHPETRSGDGRKPLLQFVGGGGVPLVRQGAVIEGDYFPIVLA